MVFASTVRFTTNTALTGPSFGGLWVGLLSGYIVSLTGEWLSLFLGCCLFVVLVVLARGLHPVSFPNLEVKPFCADGTATGGLWESRALPTVSLSEWTGECWPVCGLVFLGLLFVWWGCLVLLWGRHPHHIFVLPAWAQRRRRQRTNHLGIFAHTAPHLPNTLMAWTKAQASAESYLKL